MDVALERGRTNPTWSAQSVVHGGRPTVFSEKSCLAQTQAFPDGMSRTPTEIPGCDGRRRRRWALHVPVKCSDYIRGKLVTLLGAVFLITAEAQAQPSDSAVTHEAGPARTEVVFGTVGIGAQAVRDSLARLLAAELRRMGLSLIEDQPEDALAAWASRATLSRNALAAIWLDGRSGQGWRLIVVDAARGRAIARALPGGIRDDAASIEAVVSIAVSAASALREGLEVASTPLAAVVGEPPKETVTSPNHSAISTPPPVSVPARQETWTLRGALGPTVASFSAGAPTTEGLAVAVGATFRARVEARAFGALFMSASIRGPLGDFRVSRALFGVAAGPVFGTPAFSLAPEVGFAAERLYRYDATPAADVFAREAGVFYRFGTLVAVRLRRTLRRPLSVELLTGVMYFGRGVRFTAESAENTWSERAWPTVAVVQLGLEFATN